MAAALDIIEYSSKYMFVMDMPGLKPGDIKVQVQDDRVLVIRGERKLGKDEEEEVIRYLRDDREVVFTEHYKLPENANIDAISAVCQDGVLSVTVQKLPPHQPRKSKTIEVKAVA